MKTNALKIKNIDLGISNIKKYSLVSGLSLQNLFYVKNSEFPNCYMFSNSREESDYYFDTEDFYSKVVEKYMPQKWYQKLLWWRVPRFVFYKTFDFIKKSETIGINVVLKKENIYARVENNVNETYVLYNSYTSKGIEEFITLIKSCYKAPENEENNLFLVAHDESGFHLNKYHIKAPQNFDVEKQYNDDFVEYDKIINEFIDDKEKSGLLILHGEKGTGKTTYIRNLINKHIESKFVFVPSNMIQLLGDPGFGNFLMTLKNDIIILEDCEDVIRTRKSSSTSSSAVTLLLNMGDGLLSDDLGIKFICTFNENISNIDDALLRKGRLACKYEFKELSVEKANKLLAEVYSDRDPVPTTSKPMSLADIYNFDSMSFENERKRII